MVGIFREVRRVLRDDGTLWLNLGDTYSSSPAGNKKAANTGLNGALSSASYAERLMVKDNRNKSADCGLKAGQLAGVPWRLALALQADGWVLRQDIIWHKPCPMPESVQNRCTKSHEYLFLLTKGMGYYYDTEAIKEPSSNPESSASRYRYAVGGKQAEALREMDGKGGTRTHPIGYREFTGTKNKRSVWTVTPRGYKGAHFATFPPKLIEPCVLAGTSEWGACVKCGAPFKRVTEKTKLKRDRPNDYVKRTGEPGTGNSCSNSVAGVSIKTLGWAPTCSHPAGEVRPCLVCDPFIGSGTSAVVSLQHGRHCVGIDLFSDYLDDHCIPRVQKYLTDGKI
jgi:DNA modification methylase